MKTRYGFVSNSSSSSFVIAFPTDMKFDHDSLHDYLFPHGDESFKPWLHFNEVMTSHEVVDFLMRRINNQNEETLDRDYSGYRGYRGLSMVDETVIDILSQRSDDYQVEMIDAWTYIQNVEQFYDLPSKTERDNLLREAEAKASAALVEFLPTLNRAKAEIFGDGVQLKYVEIGDHDKNGSIMEHGDVFHNVKHIRVSHH